MALPEAFLLSMQAQLGEEFAVFLAALDLTPPVSMRWNISKTTNYKGNYEKVKWYNEGIYLTERPIFTLDPLLHAGAYYVQEASSMVIAAVVKQVLNVYKPLKVLDLCAAPGGKSTLLASILSKESFVLANEVIKPRYQILQENLVKWGSLNTHISNADSARLAALTGFFDLVLVDAPCSGEGLFRKDKKAAAAWSPAHVTHCAVRQKRILADAVKTLKSDGMLIYCTCTYNDEENEENAQWLQENFDLESVALNLPADWGVVRKSIGYQCYPHRVRGEGFYFSCFRNKNAEISQHKTAPFPHLTPLSTKLLPMLKNWLEEPEQFDFFQDKFGNVFAILKSQVSDCQIITKFVSKADFGLEVGIFKNQDFVPSHALALSTAIKKDLPALDLNKEQALRFLKKENITLESIPTGWLLVHYEGNNLGWLKGVGNRVNNYFPKNWRILMELPSDNV